MNSLVSTDPPCNTPPPPSLPHPNGDDTVENKKDTYVSVTKPTVHSYIYSAGAGSKQCTCSDGVE